MASLHNAPDSQPGWDLLQTLKHDQSSSNLQRYRSTCAQVRMAKIHIRKHLRLRLIRIPKSPATNSPVAPMTKKSNVRIILGCLLEESHSRGLRGLRRMAKSETTHKSEIYCILSFRLLRSWLDVIVAANITHSASLWPGKFCSAGTLPFCHFFPGFLEFTRCKLCWCSISYSISTAILSEVSIQPFP